MARSSGPKVSCHNTLPPLPSDCLLPKFTIPRLSTEFDLDTAIHKFATDTFATDPFLGIPIEFADLAVYSFPPTENAYKEADLRYMPDLVDISQALSLPSAQAYVRARPDEPAKQKPAADPRLFYVRSPFFESDDDPQIREQIEAAFAGQPPSGRVCLIRRAPELRALQIRGAETINPLDRQKVLLLSHQKRFLKTVPRPDGLAEGEAVTAVRAYHVSLEQVRGKCYIKHDRDGSLCQLGVIDSRYSLKGLSKKEMEEEAVTATPVEFLQEGERGLGAELND
jgi:hypothetical protein